MFLGGLLSFVFSLTLMSFILALHFGSYRSAYFVLKKLLDGKLTFSKFMQDEVLEMTTSSFAIFAVAVIMLIFSFGLFLAALLPNHKTYIIDIFSVFSFVSFGISYGCIIIFRKDTGGMSPIRGIPALIIGWGLILLSVVGLVFIIWKALSS